MFKALFQWKFPIAPRQRFIICTLVVSTSQQGQDPAVSGIIKPRESSSGAYIEERDGSEKHCLEMVESMSPSEPQSQPWTGAMPGVHPQACPALLLKL